MTLPPFFRAHRVLAVIIAAALALGGAGAVFGAAGLLGGQTSPAFLYYPLDGDWFQGMTSMMDHSGPFDGHDGTLWTYADRATRRNLTTGESLCASNSLRYPDPNNTNYNANNCELFAPGYEFHTADGQWGYYDGHEGYDWVSASSAVFAAAPGVVECADWGRTGSCSQYSSCYGYVLVIDHGNGYRTLYGHLQDGPEARLVRAGQKVTESTKVGLVGTTTKCDTITGAHLHFSVLHGDARRYVDPFGWVEWSWNEPDPLQASKFGESGPMLWRDGVPHRPGQSVAAQKGIPSNQRYLGGGGGEPLAPTPTANIPGSSTPPAGSSSQCPTAPGWSIGSLVGLRRGAEIRTAPAGGQLTVTLPSTAEQPWNVVVKDGPRCINGADWYDTDRRAAGDPAGGTGWVNRVQAQYVVPPPPPSQPAPPPAGGPYGPCDERTPGAFVYSDEFYRGGCVRVSATIPNLDAVRIEGQNVNDWINSIRLVNISYVRVCENADGGGKCLELRADKDRLTPDGMEHKISSVYFAPAPTPTSTPVAQAFAISYVRMMTESEIASRNAVAVAAGRLPYPVGTAGYVYVVAGTDIGNVALVQDEYDLMVARGESPQRGQLTWLSPPFGTGFGRFADRQELVVYVVAGAPTGTYQFRLTLPDGRSTVANVNHSNTTVPAITSVVRMSAADVAAYFAARPPAIPGVAGYVVTFSGVYAGGIGFSDGEYRAKIGRGETAQRGDFAWQTSYGRGYGGGLTGQDKLVFLSDTAPPGQYQFTFTLPDGRSLQGAVTYP